MDDSYIIKAAVEGDKYYFEYLVNSYKDRVYGFIYHMIHDSESAEDLTQDVFVKVYQNLYKINPDYGIKSWLFKIAYNTTINYLKKNKSRKKEVAFGEGFENEIQGKSYIDDFEARHVILNEIRTLKSDCKAIFLLRVVEDLSFDQIAIMLGTTTASVKLKFYRNRRILIDRLSKTFKEA